MTDISREAILLAAGGRAILLQLAVPGIGHGVARHSDFDHHPLRRLHGTLTYVYALATGTEADVAAVRRAVNRAHAPVRSAPGDDPAYTAMDPALQLWVAATLYDSAMVMHERVYGALSPDDADAIYAEYAILGTALQMPAGLWPPDRAAFRTYWDARVASLSVDETVLGVQRELFSPRKVPAWIRALMPLVRFVTIGLLPAFVRSLYALNWTPRQERRFTRLLRATATIYPRLPRAIRHAPQRYYLRRLRAHP